MALLKDLWNAKSFARLGQLMSEADSYDALSLVFRGVKLRPDLFQSVWSEAAEMRKNGKLLKRGLKIKCPVVAIHGDYDPHPVSGVKQPLGKVLKDFRFVSLKRCGHVPWMEKQARKEFFRVLAGELD